MLDKIKDLLGSDSQGVPDLIEVLGLADWYTALPESEQEKLHQYSTALGAGNLLELPVESTSDTQQGYLQSVGAKAVSDKDYKFAEKVLLKALEAPDSNPTDRHFVFNALIDLYYKQRKDRNDAIEKCVKYCKKDIESIDEFLNNFQEEYDEAPPQIPAFERLASIYETRGDYQEALEVCEKALQYEQSGFENRKQSIKDKIDG